MRSKHLSPEENYFVVEANSSVISGLNIISFLSVYRLFSLLLILIAAMLSASVNYCINGSSMALIVC